MLPSSPSEVARLLPWYGADFVLIDRALDHERGESITCETEYATHRWPIAAHFRGGPHIVPAVFLIEQASQAAALLWVLSYPGSESGPLVLNRVRARFRNPAIAPAAVRAHIVVEPTPETAFAIQARLSVDEIHIASVEAIGGVLRP